jgi:hypothetical protein
MASRQGHWEEPRMKSFIVSCIAAAVIAVGAYIVLDRMYQKPAEVAYTTTGVRL